MAKNKKIHGEDGFNEYYSQLFDVRWNVLKKSLFQEVKYAQWTVGKQTPYYLDTGSVLAALQLPLKGGKNILDLCAAPGGKSLILATLMDEDATLISNDRSSARKQRLVKVLDDSLPIDIRQRINVSCSDGAKWCTRQTECFDRILLDAPCSSERHVLQDPKYLSEWSPARIKTLALEQWSLLSSAFRMLVPGGFLLYSTCALTPEENDKVVERLFKKFTNVEVVFETIETLPNFSDEYKKFTSSILPSAEHTKFGFHILPDVQDGAGPLYFSLIKKKN